MTFKTHRKLFQFDPVTGYRYIPDQYIRYTLDRSYVITTNKEGFRGDFSYETETPGKLRILSLGDSYLAGDGVSNKDRFTDLIERDSDYLFLNTGLPGTGTDQQLLVQEHIAKNWHYDSLMICPFIHDIDRNLKDKIHVIAHGTNDFIAFNKPYFSLENNELVLHGFPVVNEQVKVDVNINSSNDLKSALSDFADKFMPSVKNSSQIKAFANRLIDYQRYIKYNYLQKSSENYFDDPHSYGWRLMKAITQRMITNAKNKKVIIIPVFQKEHIRYKAHPFYYDRFMEFKNDQTKIIDIRSIFKTYSLKATDELFNKYDNHFSPKAHQLIAEYCRPELDTFLNIQSSPVPRKKINTPVNSATDHYILGLSSYYHDSAAALIRNGEIVAAAHEERFTRIKHDKSFPTYAINYCLEEGKIEWDKIEAVVYYDDPFLSLERFVVNQIAVGEKGRNMWNANAEKWSRTKLSLTGDIRKLGYEGNIYNALHHRSHAASAFYPSPFKEAAILVLDGVGEWASTSLGVGEGHSIKILKEQHYPHSIGLLYSAFTSFCGFKVNSGEYKLMGLAPYGNGKYTQTILANILHLKEDGSFVLNMEYFSFMEGEKMYSEKFTELFGVAARKGEDELTQEYMDIAKSIQEVTEMIMLKLSEYAYKITGKDYLVMAGGVALNCVANGKILKQSPFKDIWIQPASGDAGGAIGAAFDYYYEKIADKRNSVISTNNQPSSLYGPSFNNTEIIAYLSWHKYPYQFPEKKDKYNTIAKQIQAGKVIGFFTGRMEYGPRALGARSIIADARNTKMQSTLNLKIKYRESFRPFAPVVLEEDVSEYFELDRPSPYMLIVEEVKKERQKPIPDEILKENNFIKKLNFPRSDIPAVTHLDYSARIQTVNENQNVELYKVIKAFKELTGYAVLVNTSFNVRGEPIVCTPEDAYLCFMRTEMDVLVLEDCILFKEDQPPLLNDENWKDKYELD